MSTSKGKGPATKTQVRVLCGTCMAEASPKLDGWMMSDFLLFNHMFADGPNSEDRWYTSCDPNKLLETHGVTEYLHGNPYDDRKVVLSKTVSSSKNVIVRSELDIRQAYMEDLKATFAKANKNHENVVLVLIGHGNEKRDGFSFEVGLNDLKNLRDVQFLYRQEILDLLKPYPGLKVTMILTSCFSGGWCGPEMTVLTAAGPTMESESWPESKSLARCCGSIYASIIAERMAKDEKDYGNEDKRSYQEWTDAVRSMLKYMDTQHLKHDIQFSAQNDEWGTAWAELVGLPQVEIQQRLAALPVHPAPLPVSLADGSRYSDEKKLDMGADPNYTLATRSKEEEHSERLEKEKLERAKLERGHTAGRAFRRVVNSRTGGSVRAYRQFTRAAAREYFDGEPGSNTLANNIGINIPARKCLTNENMTDEELEVLFNGLHYRNAIAQKSRDIVEALGITPYCSYKDFTSLDYAKLPSVSSDAVDIVVTKSGLIPKPDATEGRPFNKPINYIIACVVHSDMSQRQFEEKLNIVKGNMLGETLAGVRKVLAPASDSSRVGWRASIQTFMAAQTLTLKRTMRSISPEKLLPGSLRRMSIDERNKSGHRSRRSRDAGHGSGDQGHQLPF